ncbi:hypothetical protein MACH21_34050 [Roseicyclus marinus]|uniref:Uncharacterized protein n=1 Tax=Roseicyclus marinus TaxID=2161673 RepID=A0AA48HD00_9RHOB|nr:hypothetical protein MACH21_34050 [Roseicyclus marinus]
MHDQGFAGVEIGQKIFGPPPQPVDPRAGQTLGHAGRKGPAQIGAIDLCAGDPRALEHGGKAATDCLDFWKFGHSGLSFERGEGVTP